ncbi:response regulator [candidate division KSB1 bacterium]|nr:response regulator [candidate division KSB1 bacterium]
MQDPILVQSEKKILIVDDTPANVQVLAGMLKKRGYKIRISLNGRLALQAAKKDPPDLILLDISMPDINGFEVCKNLKADEQLRDIPVIFISALTDTLDKVQAFSVGGVDYMTKPFQLEEVEARVETHLMLKSAREYLKERNQILEHIFSRYVSPKVLEQVKTKPINDLLKMERRQLTLLFTDLRDFTSLTYQYPPEVIQETISSSLDILVDCIETFDGMIDKFLGDGLMAIFGAPIQQNDHSWRAIKAAMALQKTHRLWMAQRTAQNKPARPLGIGIATGDVVVGNYGTLSRMEYTALGQTVILASHLCSAAEGGEILTTPYTCEQAKLQITRRPNQSEHVHFMCENKGKLSFKNFQQPVEVISIVDSKVPLAIQAK